MRNLLVSLALLALAACTTSSPMRDSDDGSDDRAAVSKPRKEKPADSDDDVVVDDSDDAVDSPKAPPMGSRPSLAAFPGSKMFLPPRTPAPGIVMLHGSEGGSEAFIEELAASIAKEGFVVVTHCWFGCAGKKPTIERLPLESVVEMGTWLTGAPEVGGKKVGVFGWSRGAELALLVTSLTGKAPFAAVAVHAPSDTVVSAFDPASQNEPPNFGGIVEGGKPAPSWTWKGNELFGEPGADFSVPGPKIDVAKFPGALYVSHGEDDEVWEAARGRRVVAARKAVAGLVTESHFFPGEGHVLAKPANIEARRTELARFFTKHL